VRVGPRRAAACPSPRPCRRRCEASCARRPAGAAQPQAAAGSGRRSAVSWSGNVRPQFECQNPQNGNSLRRSIGSSSNTNVIPQMPLSSAATSDSASTHPSLQRLTPPHSAALSQDRRRPPASNLSPDSTATLLHVATASFPPPSHRLSVSLSTHAAEKLHSLARSPRLPTKRADARCHKHAACPRPQCRLPPAPSCRRPLSSDLSCKNMRSPPAHR
jgi:hypothetical protein